MQERGNVFVWFVFHAVAFYSSASRWLRFKRVCKWYHAPIRIGGNPFARKLTHGMCRDCAARWQAEVDSHGAA
jgi:hypothetical protein